MKKLGQNDLFVAALLIGSIIAFFVAFFLVMALFEIFGRI